MWAEVKGRVTYPLVTGRALAVIPLLRDPAGRQSTLLLLEGIGEVTKEKKTFVTFFFWKFLFKKPSSYLVQCQTSQSSFCD